MYSCKTFVPAKKILTFVPAKAGKRHFSNLCIGTNTFSALNAFFYSIPESVGHSTIPQDIINDLRVFVENLKHEQALVTGLAETKRKIRNQANAKHSKSIRKKNQKEIRTYFTYKA